jgi:HNH endonuclease
MAISKRLRYEILRRDNYTCRYCGRSTPDVSLTVDHVVPESLGGSDSPPNLVTACPDCNSGKTSSMPDSPLVAAVADDAARWAAAMKQAVEENRMDNNTAVHEAVVGAWPSYRRSREIPTDYRETIDRILAAGLPAEDVVAMARVADAKASVNDRWAYFCGCCWTRIRSLQERASEIFSASVQETPTTAQLAPHPQQAVDQEERCRATTRWFKPIWYGEAREAGYMRWVQVHPDDLEAARRDAADKSPNEPGHIDAEGRVYLTDAPRPPQWIETVADLLDTGLPKSAIADNVRAAMAAPIEHQDRWQLFVTLCRRQLNPDAAEETRPHG